MENASTIIWNCVNHYACEDAIGLAELVYNYCYEDEALFLLATAYYHAGMVMSAYLLLKSRGANTDEARFLLAKCCLDLDKLSTAEDILSELLKANDEENDQNAISDSYPYALNLLGTVYARTARPDKAIECYRKCLKVNPFLLSAYRSACALGCKLDSTALNLDPNNRIYSQTNEHLRPVARPIFPKGRLPEFGIGRPSVTPLSSQPTSVVSSMGSGNAKAIHSGFNSIAYTPSPYCVGVPSGDTFTEDGTGNASILSSVISASTQHDTSPSRVIKPPKAPKKTSNRRLQAPSGSGGSDPTPTTSNRLQPGGSVLTQSQADSAPRRSSRLRQMSKENSNMNSAMLNSGAGHRLSQRNSISTRSKLTGGNLSRRITASAKTPADSDGGTRASQQRVSVAEINALNKKLSDDCSEEEKHTEATETPRIMDGDCVTVQSAECQTDNLLVERLKGADFVQRQENCIMSREKLLELTKLWADVESAISVFDSNRAIKLLSDLPESLTKTGWAFSVLAKAYFELGNYNKAVEIFRQCRAVADHYLRGMELYSTCLWHTHQEVELSALSQELTEHFRLSPITACTAGNCFSLQREHETAIKFFERAIQLDPSFAYAYNLLGCEHIEMEEFETAQQCFRSALRHQPRNYSAWFGIGNVYCKLGKLELAERYFRKALSINPRNPVLICHVAVTLHRQHKYDIALRVVERALTLNPENALCHYQKAECLFAVQQFQEALIVLEKLKQMVPKESKIYLLAGKVYKKLGQNHLALMHFSWAMDLDPRGGVNHLTSAPGDRYEQEPVTALATMEPDDPVFAQAMESDDSYL